MAFTTSISFSKKDLRLSNFYTKNYFIKRFKRIILPLIPVFILTLLIGIVFKKPINLGIKNIIGMMPISGAGNYYITIVLQYIILSPFFYYFYKRLNKLSLVISLVINVLFELFTKIVFPNAGYLYSSSIFRYIFLIFLGYYLFDLIKYNKSIPKLFYIGILISIIYLFIVSNDSSSINIFLSSWKTQLFISAFYPFILTFLGFKFLNFNLNILTQIGKSSYHIFLIQMIYFIVNPVNKITSNLLIQVIINVIFCIIIGYIFYKLEGYIQKSK
jgi:hypothetical protein